MIIKEEEKKSNDIKLFEHNIDYWDVSNVNIEKNKIIKYVETRFTLLSTILTIAVIYRLALFILLIVTGAATIDHYTYWNYAIQTVFYMVLLIGYKLKSTYLLDAITFFVLPSIFGSIFFVFLYIIIVLQFDSGDLFIKATVLDGGKLAVGTVHTMDHILHTFIVIDFLVVMLSGYIKHARSITHIYYSRAETRVERVMFFLYFIFSPLIPIAIYSLFFNPTKEYPTNIHPLVPMSIGIGFYTLIMLWVYALLKTKKYGKFSNK